MTEQDATEILHPDVLPQGNGQFIAYGAERREADPAGGNPITIRPQTYVTYYRDIAIQSIGKGRNENDSVTRVEFDPESIGLREPIGANLDPDDPLVQYLTEAQEAGKTVSIGIEVIRKAKRKTDKTPISPFTPIHALRGASDARGTGAQTNASGETTRKMLVLVDGRRGKALTSDPTEWAVLLNNKAGDLPPEGWKFYGDAEDWTQYGVIVPDGERPRPGTAPGAQAIDPAELVRALGPGLTTVIREAVAAEFANQATAQQASTQPAGRPVGRGFNEGKPWDVRTNDGRVNLGGYMVGGYGWAFRWAHDHLVALTEDEDTTVDDEQVLTLVNHVFAIADQVQADAYGHGVDSDRTSASHKEARHWVEWVIEHEAAYPVDGDEDEVSAWADVVTEGAANHLRRGGAFVGDYLTSKSEAQKAARQQPAKQESKDEGPAPQVVQALLDLVAKKWSDPQAITNVGKDITERGWADLPVSMVTDDEGAPTISFPAVEGQPTGGLKSLLLSRYNALQGTESPPQQAQQAAPAPQQAQQAAPQQEAGLDPLAAGFIRHVSAVSGLDGVQTLFLKAEEGNMLGVEVPVRENAEGVLEYDETGTAEGFTRRTVAQILERLRGKFSEPTASEASESAGGDEPEQAAPAEEPEQASAQPEAEVTGDDEPAAEPEAEQEQEQEEAADEQEAAQEEETPAPAAEEPAAEEPKAEEPADPKTEAAQEIADKVSAIYDKVSGPDDVKGAQDEITALREQATNDDLLAIRIVVGGRKGVLRTWIDNRLNHLTRPSA